MDGSGIWYKLVEHWKISYIQITWPFLFSVHKMQSAGNRIFHSIRMFTIIERPYGEETHALNLKGEDHLRGLGVVILGKENIWEYKFYLHHFVLIY